MTETTKNLELIKESEEEFYNVETVNGNWDKVDAGFDKIKHCHVLRIPGTYNNEIRYVGFASLPVPSSGGRAEVTFLVSGVGNIASHSCGTYLIQCGTRDHTSMAVTELTPPGSDGDITFGYWLAGDRVIFGMKRGPYNYHTNIAMISEDVNGEGFQKYEIAELYNAAAKPSGWTAAGKRKFLISDGNAVSATKAVQDGNGDVITEVYAKRSIYGDNVISLGRKKGDSVGVRSFAFGNNVVASGEDSYAHGSNAKASGTVSHAEGTGTEASGYGSHAEGSDTTASGTYSHAEGYNTEAGGYASHAEGNRTTVNGQAAHAEGYNNTASGKYSHAEGNQTEAVGECSHTEGVCTTADNYASHACGKFSKAMAGGGADNTQVGDVFVIGNGTYRSYNFNRSNALRVTYTGDIMGTKAFQSSGADYAEFIKPWADGNVNNEDRVGYFVTVKNGLLYKADAGDYIAGITSGNPSVVGNADEDYYWRYERDAFNRIVMEDVRETVQKTDGEGKPVFDETTYEPVMEETGRIIKNARMKLADNYDPSLQDGYIERKDRKEWDYVGMIGVLPVRDDGTCIPGRFCRCGKDGIATFTETRGYDTYMVLERICDHIISVILK